MLFSQTGLTHSDSARVTPGLTLIAPMQGDMVFLVDETGGEVHRWHTGVGLTKWCYMLPGGRLLANERVANPSGVDLTLSGRVSIYDWDSTLIWQHDDPGQHHDARQLDDGRLIYLANTPLTDKERAAIVGGVPGTEPEGGPFGEVIREVDSTGTIRWEWPFTNFGFDRFPLHRNANRWVHGHANTIQPLRDGRYLVPSKVMNLIFIVNPATDKVEWHYQNDAMGGQHDVQMLDSGNILLFANGTYAPYLHASEVWELNPDTKEIVWRYRQKDNPLAFYSPMVSGCQRLPSSNTLVCEGAKGCVAEVTPEGDVVRQYINPVFNSHEKLGSFNWLFRARRYARDGQEIEKRV
ncbi:MAG: arylsulfotransferase family protein [Sulfitobacter sp.]